MTDTVPLRHEPGRGPRKRPTAITVIAWVAIVGGVFMLLGGVLGAEMFSFMTAMGGDTFPAVAETASGPLRPMAVVFRHFDHLAPAQAILAGFVIIAGIYFLKLRAWARTFLESICWLGITYGIAFGTYWVFVWDDLSISSPVPDQGPGMPRPFGLIGAAIGAVVTLFNLAPLAVAVWFLRSKKVRDAVR
jgi:hypothetical protein